MNIGAARLAGRLHASAPKQAGLSLVELMIGMLVGLILLGGVIQTLFVSKEAQRSRQNMAEVTENARFLFDFMTRDMRMAGRGYGTADWDAGVLATPVAVGGGGALQLGYYSDEGGGSFVRVSYRLNGDEILYSRTGLTAAEEVLIDGVGQFDVLYGVHTAVGIQYVASGAVANWDDVGSVRVTLGFTDANQAGVRSLTSTMALRNRMAAIYSPE